MGGRVSLCYASQYPSKIKGMILESSTAGIENIDERKERLQNDFKLAERIEQQQQHLIEEQAKDLQLMKDHINKLLTVNLQKENTVHDAILELEEKNEAAERRAQYLEIKVMGFKNDRNSKREVAPLEPPDDGDDDPLDPDSFSEGSYHGDGEEDEEEESPEESPFSESEPEAPTPVPLTR